MMKRSLLISLGIAFLINSLLADLNISGVNEFKFIHSNRILEYRSYFSDKMQLQAQFNNFRAYIKYDFYRPHFNKFALINDNMSNSTIETLLASEKNENYFDDYYLQYESDYWFVQAGKYEAVIGSGMVLHNFYDVDFELDSRLIGGYLNPVFDKWQLQLFGGLLESDDPMLQDKFDQLGAIDLDLNLIDNLTFGGSFILHKELINTSEEYKNRYVFAGKINYYSSIFDFNTEIATSDDYNNVQGSAIFTNLTTYLGKFTLAGTYKKYRNFNVRISDLPMVNHAGQQLEHSWDPGKDEEGLMSEIRFLPDYDNEFIINYAEGWSSNYNVRLSNLYTEFKHNFEDWSLKTEFETLEQLNKEDSKHWYKEITPAITLDFLIYNNPVLIKTEYQYKKEDNFAGVQSHYEPRFQSDLAYRDISLSFTLESQIGESLATEDGDNGEFWIGGEFAVEVFTNTDIRIFYGKEKGGIVCRNGICKNQAEFEGLRARITTSF
ncbi:MAG: DUF6029 family protein [Candidatus Cloacimonetes bacterium]|nr:DUF6029 family protein [Candidatus Cloacimonadota bacterium]